jgi:hypothetical protein
MPTQACSVEGSPGWKWGNAGKCYTYAAGDTAASGKAKQKAYLQGYAEGGGKLLKSGEMEDEHLLVHHAVLHKRDLGGIDVLHEHVTVALEMEERGFDHLMYTDLDYHSELLLKAGLADSSLGTMGGGTGILSPQQGGGIKSASKQKAGDACPMCKTTMVSGDGGVSCPSCGYTVPKSKKFSQESSGPQASMYKRYIDSVTRVHIPSEDYVDPARRRFPIQVPGDIASAMHAFGLAKPLIPIQQFRRRLITIARRKGQAFVDELPKSWLDGTDMTKSSLALTDGEIATYNVLTKSDTQRFTLGVMYPVDETDSQEEYADAETVEQAAWWFMQKGGQAGYMHIMGAGGKRFGDVVESYIYRNPEPWKVTDVAGKEQLIKKGDWVGGVIWTPPIWSDILSGKLGGYSVHGTKVVEAVQAQII